MISVLCPTRNRPDNIARLVGSGLATAMFPQIEWIFYVDDDDAISIPAIESATDNYKLVHGPRIVLSEMWNALATVASNDIMMHCGDDIIFRSEHWDVRVLEEFAKVPDHILLVHGRDGIQDAGLATHGFIHRKWVETLGYFVPPYFSSDYNDVWNTEVADALGRRVYRPDIYTEHMHFTVGKSVIDQTHADRLQRHERDNVAAMYNSKAWERTLDAEKLRAVMQ